MERKKVRYCDKLGEGFSVTSNLLMLIGACKELDPRYLPVQLKH